MSQNTKIEWCDSTLNPFYGCTKVSPGCQYCYALRMIHRLPKSTALPMWETYTNTGEWTGKILNNVNVMKKALSWRKPRKIFLGSMCDIFHDNVLMDDIHEVFDYVRRMPQHTFMLLTKRPENMKKAIESYNTSLMGNLWLGLTVCNQEEAEQKIPILLRTPGTVRFVSIEPMLGAVNLTDIQCIICDAPDVSFNALTGISDKEKLNWVICGGETGTRARQMDLDWARSLRDRCAEADVPFFFKSTGGKSKSDLLDGKTHKEFPIAVI